jgi:hypothetical protein
MTPKTAVVSEESAASSRVAVGVVVTDTVSTIVSLDANASALLNIGTRDSRLRYLRNFFTSGRYELLAAIQRVHAGGMPIELRHTLRPRERRPIDVLVRLSADGTDIRWELQRITDSTDAAAGTTSQN